MQTIKPAPGYVFAEHLQEEKERKTKTGILIPDKVRTEQNIAKIINVADYTEGFTHGDVILYKSYGITEIKLNDTTYLMIHTDDILGRVLDAKT